MLLLAERRPAAGRAHRGRLRRNSLPSVAADLHPAWAITADIGWMADVSQAPAGQDQSRPDYSGDETDFRDFCQKPEKMPRRPVPALGADVAANSKGAAPGAIQVDNPGRPQVLMQSDGALAAFLIAMCSAPIFHPAITQNPSGTSINRKGSS